MVEYLVESAYDYGEEEGELEWGTDDTFTNISDAIKRYDWYIRFSTKGGYKHDRYRIRRVESEILSSNCP